ncbi:MAG TPA: GAF domain-containing protein, partial [Candidatus Binatia bacterium]|nr:GAF domain-containing protein [Candidatus Binatia bacterium]
RDVLQRGFAEAGAHEGTIWLLDNDGKHLVPACNTGPDADKMVGKFRQPLSSGLICMVFASEQPIVENEVYKNVRLCKALDEMLQVETYALIAAPFHFLKACRGVISCVQLKRPGTKDRDLPGFEFGHLTAIQRAAALLAQLIELRVLGSAVGWSS